MLIYKQYIIIVTSVAERK